MPLPVNSMLSLESFALTTLSVIIVPDVESVLSPIDKELKVPAPGVVPPITTLSIEPPSRSMDPKTILPVPFGLSSKLLLDLVTLITLSDRLKLESIVRLDMLTTPVPPGVNRKSAFELVEIILSLMVILSIGTGAANVVEPVDPSLADKLPNVESPDTSKLPVVDKFSFPKLIAPDESLMIPFNKSNCPNCDPVAAESVPVVVKFSSPKLIDPPTKLTISPSLRSIFPNCDPDAPDIVPSTVAAPSTLNVPSTLTFSLMFIIVESSELIVVPENPTLEIFILPDPLGTIFKSSLVRTV